MLQPFVRVNSQVLQCTSYLMCVDRGVRRLRYVGRLKCVVRFSCVC